ncbi:Cas1p-domain-containing protein [Hypoxylon sp. NC1633]|nr:Cas1p-domain-containing protein [Hypoxylon sp. NC1633]
MEQIPVLFNWPTIPPRRLSIIFVGLIMCLLYSRQYGYSQQDPYRCQALLNDGEWSPASLNQSRRWEPEGCRMVEYSGQDIHNCLDGQKIVLVGDSTIRQLFWAVVKKLDPTQAKAEAKDVLATERRHRDLSFESNGVKIEYIWDTWLNSTALKDTLETFHPLPSPQKGSTVVAHDGSQPALVLVGAPGLWAARFGGDESLDIFKHGVSSIAPYLSSSLEQDISLAKAQGLTGSANQIFLAPVPVPDYDRLSPNRSGTITPERIEELNRHLLNLTRTQQSHIPWTYNELTADYGELHKPDGLHASESVAAHKLDIILNARCNAVSSARSRSFRGTCCVAKSQGYIVTGLVFLWVIAVLSRIPLHLMMQIRHQKFFRFDTLDAGLVLFSVLVWCWICDATNTVGHVERHYQQSEFVVACLLWLSTSFATAFRNETPSDDKLTPIQRLTQSPPGYKGPGYFSREHADEIKGLMQGFILLYHFYHASQALWVYKVIRLFMSGYIYLSGYGHTMYMLKTRDYSGARVAAVLFRLNVLSALLPYFTGTEYTLYYFAPVVSFWYLVTWVALRFFSCRNRHLVWLVIKLALTALLTDWLIRTPGVLELLAQASEMSFRLHWDAAEMRFRLQLDRYAVYVGVLAAALVHRASVRRARLALALGHHRIKNARGRLATATRRQLLNVACVYAIAIFLYVTQRGERFGAKERYNAVHPYIAWVPVLAYVILRNSFCHDYALGLPAALGRFALETYVLQHHIWLGGDATARLHLGVLAGVWGRRFESVLLGLAFWGVAALTHAATETLARRMDGRWFGVFVLALWGANVVYGW